MLRAQQSTCQAIKGNFKVLCDRPNRLERCALVLSTGYGSIGLERTQVVSDLGVLLQSLYNTVQYI
jgi:hypothetical protein